MNFLNRKYNLKELLTIRDTADTAADIMKTLEEKYGEIYRPLNLMAVLALISAILSRDDAGEEIFQLMYKYYLRMVREIDD